MSEQERKAEDTRRLGIANEMFDAIKNYLEAHGHRGVGFFPPRVKKRGAFHELTIKFSTAANADLRAHE